MKGKQAFTLIELLVVVLIIGILAAVALPQYEQAVMKSRYATLKANVKSIYDAQQLYFLANGVWAEDFDALTLDLTGCTLSADKKECVYPWGKCHFASGNNGELGRGVCQNTTTLKNAYVRHWKGGQSPQTCWAFTSDPTDKYGKLCEREGGIYRGSSTCTHAFGSVCQTYPITK